MKRFCMAMLFVSFFAAYSWAQKDGQLRVNPEEKEVDMDNPTFVPMVKVGRVLDKGDSICGVEQDICLPAADV